MDGWRQQGMTLIEVLLAMALLGVGLFAAAGLQLRALQATDSALRGTQAAYLAQGVFEQARAVEVLREEDRVWFQAQVGGVLGAGAQGQVALTTGELRVLIDWDDSRAGWQRRSLSLAGRLAP
ncbi:prepilin-type N-terminal cleavage/methylation domain-containing protein [Pseudomonas sp. NPDC090755]|uniref:type IV pilus modification PilV family protein n=1 Tax=Pseudomonas sp. NPDC090755 TaxID=3364481 RepID=UPI00383BEC85